MGGGASALAEQAQALLKTPHSPKAAAAEKAPVVHAVEPRSQNEFTRASFVSASCSSSRREPASPQIGGLAARRQVPGLQVAVVKREGPLERGERWPEREKGAATAVEDGKRAITSVGNISHFLRFGREVMPSTNRGMEVVYADRVSDGKQVVVKIRDKTTSFSCKEDEEEWRETTQMLLNMPISDSIAQIHEVKEDARKYYVVMEKCNGKDLFELMQNVKMGADAAKPILRQLLMAVHALHAKGCIHKDLKLENVMVDSPRSPNSSKNRRRSVQRMEEDEPDPIVKLVDFDTVEGFSNGQSERVKSVVGTDQYIAQEAYAGKYSPASDIFAVGVIAYRLICGRFPFQARMFDDKPGENRVGSPKMKEIQDRLKKFRIDWGIAPWPTEPKALALTRWMLSSNEHDRPTASQALQHAFLERTGTTPGPPLKNSFLFG